MEHLLSQEGRRFTQNRQNNNSHICKMHSVSNHNRTRGTGSH